MRRRLVSRLAPLVLLVWPSLSLAAAPTGPTPPRTTPPDATGTYGASVLVGGRAVGRVVESEINCVGHATGLGEAVYLEKQGTLEDLMTGLGYSCRVGDSDATADAIAAGRPVMMVYVYMYPPDWREPRDRELSYEQLAARHGWSQDVWRRPHAFYDRRGKGLPLDYHAVRFNPDLGRWDWVARARDKSGGAYAVDSSPFEPAAADPDLYFARERVIVSLACQR